MVETAYLQSHYRAPEIAHTYGENVHLLDDPLAWTQLAREQEWFSASSCDADCAC